MAILAFSSLASAACSSDPARAPLEADAGADGAVPSPDAGSDANAATGRFDCEGTTCRADQVCLKRCAAMRTSEGACILGPPPSGAEFVCVDLPKGCTDACDCLTLETYCPLSGPRTVLYCQAESSQRVDCQCGCSF